MARKPRIDCIGYYHLLNRGVERRAIFLDNYDREFFMELIDEIREVYMFRVHAFCLMDNHYHLLIETMRENLSLILKQLNQRYTHYFNKKYNRVGTLWQGRFKSWYIYDDHYLEVATKYIEYNPIKAGINAHVGEYPWASAVTQEAPWNPNDEADLSRFQMMKILKCENSIVQTKKITLKEHFAHMGRNESIMNAVCDGYRQCEIAHYLNLGDVSISKIIKNEKNKEKLFEKLKNRGIFWSYDPSISLHQIGNTLFIEYTLKYGDFDDIVELFGLYGKKVIFRVWERELKNDLRFKKLNLFLARLFFGMDIEADYFQGGMNEREKKLRLLAS